MQRSLSARWPDAVVFCKTIVEACASAVAERSSERSAERGQPPPMVLVLGGKHDMGEGGIRLATKGMRVIGVEGVNGDSSPRRVGGDAYMYRRFRWRVIDCFLFPLSWKPLLWPGGSRFVLTCRMTSSYTFIVLRKNRNDIARSSQKTWVQRKKRNPDADFNAPSPTALTQGSMVACPCWRAARDLTPSNVPRARFSCGRCTFAQGYLLLFPLGRCPRPRLLPLLLLLLPLKSLANKCALLRKRVSGACRGQTDAKGTRHPQGMHRSMGRGDLVGLGNQV